MAIKRNLTDKARACIIAYAEKGLVDAEIKKAVGISDTIWKRWLSEQPELRDEIQDARLPSVDDVEAAYYLRAMGYEYEETYTERKALTDSPR